MTSATQRRTPARVVEDIFQRTYDRWGLRGSLLLGMAILTVAVLVVSFFVIMSFSSYAGLSRGRVVPYAASGCVLITLGLLIGLLACRRQVNALFGWSNETPSPDKAVEVWAGAMSLPQVVAVRCSVGALVLVMFNQLLIYREFDLSWAAFPVNATGIALMVASGGFASMLFLDFVLRPLTTDLARWLPPDFEPDPPRLALYTKAILPVPGIVIYTALIVIGLVDTSAGFTARISQGVFISIAISLAAVALYYILAHAFLDPIDQLTEATRRVHAGDLDTRVVVTSGDELGGLAMSFNQMLDGLQERERLRSHNVELSGRLEETLEEVRASRARIVAAADEERRRMERDLHDGAQQRLVMISLKLGMAAELVGHDPAAAAAIHEELRKDASRAIEELRDLAHGIYPPLLESDGLAPALEDVADQSALPVEIDSDGAGRYPAAVEAAVYFCCLEALQNAAKHAGPDCRATIHLSEADGILHFSVADNGQGFDTSGVNGSAGLQNMKDRIGALGGALTVRSESGSGTTVEGSVPV